MSYTICYMIGEFGAKISDWLYTYNLTEALTPTPEIVIYYGDSDCSDVYENNMTEEEIIKIREQYNINLILLIERVLAIGAHMVLAGPGGERV